MFGKKRTFVIVLGLLAVGTLISAVSTSIAVMIVGRVIQGAGGAIFPLAFGIIRDEFPAERRAGGIRVDLGASRRRRWRRHRALRADHGASLLPLAFAAMANLIVEPSPPNRPASRPR